VWIVSANVDIVIAIAVWCNTVDKVFLIGCDVPSYYFDVILSVIRCDFLNLFIYSCYCDEVQLLCVQYCGRNYP
jgi:hypothetical protein